MPPAATGSRRSCEKAGGLRALLAAALLCLLKAIEQAPGIGACKGLQPVRLTLLDAITRERSFGPKVFGLLLHLAVPHVRIELADIHEDAHLGDGLQLRCAGSPHVS